MKLWLRISVFCQTIFICGVMQAQETTAPLGAMATNIPVAGASTMELDIRFAVTKGAGHLLGWR